jgi:glycosyltransferase involved in cell wall biosynthesis
LYLGAGHRIVPQWGGKYDVVLMEDRRDFRSGFVCHPFYKTASSNIFHPIEIKKDYDICWPCNFTQIRQKGQEDFIRIVSNDEFLKSLKIAHCGNKKNVAGRMCKKFGVENIEFHGELNRVELNKLLNRSKFGLNNSNRIDGCPRVSTEILMSGQPLLIRNETRLLPYFKRRGVVEYALGNMGKKIKGALDNYDNIQADLHKAISNELSFDSVTKKNVELWKELLKKKGSG